MKVLLKDWMNELKSSGEIVIKKVNDKVHPEGYSLRQSDVAYIERVIVYRDREKENGVKGKPWSPTLDTSLWDYCMMMSPNKETKDAMNTACEHDISTIREFIALPYGWFEHDWSEKEYEKIRRDLNKHGFKMYKKGNVIDD